ncbi:MAG: helix-turn-helix transcriptional regulator [Candidatus Hydrogenedentes bacterium]|nr:helix-turn-helix transcriptional regulator [Candidatus Hydrogenedentota bacterium]
MGKVMETLESQLHLDALPALPYADGSWVLNAMSHTSRLHDQILEALLAGPEYGYPLAQTIKQRAPGLLDNQEALIYPALHELENDGLLISYEVTAQDRTRRYYKLSERGMKRALEEKKNSTATAKAAALKPLTGDV